MCYEWHFWRYAAGRMTKQEEPKPVSERRRRQPVNPLSQFRWLGRIKRNQRQQSWNRSNPSEPSLFPATKPPP
jgi:hypothetical protein